MLGVLAFMKLSEQESRWLSCWEKRERMWPLTRWVCIFAGIFTTAGGIFLFHQLLVSDFPDRLSLLFVPFFFLGMGGVWFGLALSKWRGDIKLRLLLRLIREHEDKDT
jgi:hypothetical protein